MSGVDHHDARVDEQLDLLGPALLTAQQMQRVGAHRGHRTDRDDSTTPGGDGKELLVLVPSSQRWQIEGSHCSGDRQLDPGGQQGPFALVADQQSAERVVPDLDPCVVKVDVHLIGRLAQHPRHRDGEGDRQEGGHDRELCPPTVDAERHGNDQARHCCPAERGDESADADQASSCRGQSRPGRHPQRPYVARPGSHVTSGRGRSRAHRWALPRIRRRPRASSAPPPGPASVRSRRSATTR